MATMTRDARAGATVFEVPIADRLPTAPLLATATLILRTEGPGARPGSLQLRLAAQPAAFMAKLPNLLRDSGFPGDVFALGRAARTARPVLHFEAGPAVLSRVPGGLDGLAKVEAYLAEGPPIFDMAGYTLVAITFDQGRTSRQAR